MAVLILCVLSYVTLIGICTCILWSSRGVYGVSRFNIRTRLSSKRFSIAEGVLSRADFVLRKQVLGNKSLEAMQILCENFFRRAYTLRGKCI